MRTQLKARAAGVAIGLSVLLPISSATAETYYIDAKVSASYEEPRMARLEYPFNPNNQTSIAAYFSNINWDDGSKRVFFNLRRCAFGLFNQYYECRADYKQINPRGERVCLNASIGQWGLNRDEDISLGTNGDLIFNGNISSCGPYTEVQPDPEPQPTTTPPAQPSPGQSPAADKLTYTPEQIAIGAGSAFLIGGVFGAVLGLAAGKKKGTWNDV